MYQNLLKLDNPSSSYGQKIFGVFFMYHSVRGYTTSTKVNSAFHLSVVGKLSVGLSGCG